MVSATASRSIQAIISTSPVPCCWAMAGTRPWASNWMAAIMVSIADLGYVVAATLGIGLASSGNGAYNREP